MKQLRLFLALQLLPFMLMINPTFGGQSPEPETPQYSLHRSEIITDLAVIASLWLAQELIPLNMDSQRLFPDEVNRLDRSIRDKWHTRSDNFFNGGLGSSYTFITTGVVITGLDLIEGTSLPRAGNQLFIFLNGALANKYLTRSFKYAFSRRRPLLEFADAADKEELNAIDKNHASFYSGHASTASFSAAFLRRRISQTLERRGHAGVKSGYQWLTGITLYGGAAYVAYSRIQIDKHYFTDVVVGMIMGSLFEEIYHRLNQKHWDSYPSWRLAPQVRSGSFQLCFEKSFS